MHILITVSYKKQFNKELGLNLNLIFQIFYTQSHVYAPAIAEHKLSVWFRE